jgi:acyl-CoA synthetase (AMP-forming)/AMP-acid ligase II
VDFLAGHAEGQPDKLALVEPGRELTWRQVVEQRNRLSNALLELGLAQGDRVISYGANSVDLQLVSAAVTGMGAITVPMNRMLVGEEVAYILQHSDARAAFVDDRYLPVIEEVRAQAPGIEHWILFGADQRRDWALAMDDLLAKHGPEAPEVELDEGSAGGAMMYTSGTTGKPKGALRRSIDTGMVFTWLEQFDLIDGEHVHLVAGPLYHSAPAAFATFSMVLGNTVVIMPRFEPREALRLIEQYGVTTTFMAPTIIKRILDLPDEVKDSFDVSSMKVLVTGAAPCPQNLKEAANEFFAGAMFEFYGSTELGINTVLRPEDVSAKPGSCGRVMPGMEMAAFDDDGNQLAVGQEGELHVRRYQGMFDEYYKNDEATQDAYIGEWASVGDVGRIDEDGFVFIGDRKKDMIISGGVNIYPAEIEDVLHRIPAVDDAAVFGVPDEEFGERVHAAVSLHPGAQLTESDLVSFCREHLAGYKIPREVSFRDELPRTPTGKLLKRELREPYWAGQERRI